MDGRKLGRRVSSRMRRHQTGKFVRVLSYRNCDTPIETVRDVKTGLESTRFFMLLIFCFASMISGVSYTTYTIIANVTKKYFRVRYSTIDLTSMVYIVGYIMPLFPIIWLIEKKGLRTGFVFGAVGTAFGFWIAFFVERDFFWVIILSQAVIGSFQTCFMPLTPQFASVWFGPREISSACSVGIFFNTLGNALSCIIPPLIVRSEKIDEIQQEFKILALSYAIFASVVAVVAIVCFREKPKLPPTLVQAIVRKNNERNTSSPTQAIVRDVKKLVKNRSFILHMISYGIGFSIADVVAAILNHMVLLVHPTAGRAVGLLGLLIHLPGVPASLLFGIIMDRTHKYKETALGVYVGALLSFVFFMAGFYLPMETLFAAAAFLGFFGAGYLPIGLELGAELTYPVPEVTSSGLLIMSGAIFTIVLTYGTDMVLTVYGVLPAQLILLVLIICGLISACFVKADLKRLKACEEAEMTLGPISIISDGKASRK